MMVVIQQLLEALNLISSSRWTLEFDGSSRILFKAWNKGTGSCTSSDEIKFVSSNSWEQEAKELVQLTIVREATPPEDNNG